MPLSRSIARTNRYWINPIARRLAGTIPPFLLICHVGRRSGKPYETPIWAFRRGERFLIVLTYGPTTDWLRNLETAGHADAQYARHRWSLTNPVVEELEPGEMPLPRPVRWVLRRIRVRHFLWVDARRLDQ